MVNLEGRDNNSLKNLKWQQGLSNESLERFFNSFYNGAIFLYFELIVYEKMHFKVLADSCDIKIFAPIHQN